jgi:hypothetical protein
MMLACLAGCSWFHAKPRAPDPTELIVSGAPANSVLIVDGAPAHEANAGGRSRILQVTPGSHTLEVRAGDKTVYRESVDVGAGEKRAITVLSGAS